MDGRFAEAKRAIAAALERDRVAFERADGAASARRVRRRRRRWPLAVGAAGLYLFVVSPLCLGPAVYLDERRLYPAAKWAFAAAAMPSAMLIEAAGLGGRADPYVRWWAGLAREHYR